MTDKESPEVKEAVRSIMNAHACFIMPRFGPTCEMWVRISKIEARRLVRNHAYPGMKIETDEDGDVYIH
jgi:hypothetical protein